MNITVLGATGSVGSRVVTEAVTRGHQVTAVVRDPARAAALPAAARIRTGDAGDPRRIAELAQGQDVVVSATRPAPGNEPELALFAHASLTGLHGTGVRLLLVGGAASLTVPDGTPLVDTPDFPSALLPIARACNAQLDVCRTTPYDVDWAYASPPAVLEAGERTGRYRLGADELIVAADGTCALSMEDLAVVLLDEAERPRHHRERFTAGY
ncbi:NAD(P)-dependent oxidoreductase [Streptomyces sp. VRA16 Mangrove soil]|uniref:NAD(P)-dependent oxidoreductase n=1 Tax=Streptomyces sp. VRA16 Mangrove soil TaxID=2817434 RepID=UPI001A9DCCD5|nr:NAD(P)H-binding protein [Streptomyces sp. VRA16 Mangrove soil]MBO1332914.1 NAD(P)H-binding protein [Streptomyces sp. VRA16 Mangrove soil]